MRPEEILLEAEKRGLRQKVLAKVRAMRELIPRADINSLYDLVWEEVQREQRT